MTDLLRADRQGSVFDVEVFIILNSALFWQSNQHFVVIATEVLFEILERIH